MSGEYDKPPFVNKQSQGQTKNQEKTIKRESPTKSGYMTSDGTDLTL